MSWQGIEGHDEVAAAFARAAGRGRIAGSYLFIGPEGVGKSTFALALAKALTCEAATGDLLPCGRCGSCLQADAGSHPDIDVVAKPDERATIPLELLIGSAEHRMREGLCWRILLKPALGRRKVAVIRDADSLSEEAANCLLKTLEEPPEAAVIILVGSSLQRQLPTIRSRCQVVRFGPLSPDTIARVLESEETGGEPGEIEPAAAASGGSLATARLLTDPALAGFRGRLFSLLARNPLPGVELAREVTALVEAAGKEAAIRRPRLRVVLEFAIEFYRAALRHAAGASLPADATLAREVAVWTANCRHDPAEDATTAIGHTLDTMQSIDRNLHLGMLIDAWTALLEEPRLAAARG
jgi:DNA polymerase III subunit delta'